MGDWEITTHGESNSSLTNDRIAERHGTAENERMHSVAWPQRRTLHHNRIKFDRGQPTFLRLSLYTHWDWKSETLVRKA